MFKNSNLKTYSLLLYFFAFSFVATSQVGINTTSPDGILDVSSTTHGIVLPRVALTTTDVATPILNPAGGTLQAGTVVYNTNTSSTGANDVVPGIYVWTGSEWSSKFTKKQAAFYAQTTETRPSGSAGVEDITGLINRTFTANYTGAYRIEISVNYGGGFVNNNSSDTDVVAQKADFLFTFNGTTHTIPASAWSVDGATEYYLIWEQSSIVLYEALTATTDYTFSLQIDQEDCLGCVNNGDSGDGRGYTGYDIPCSVEFIYIGD